MSTGCRRRRTGKLKSCSAKLEQAGAKPCVWLQSIFLQIFLTTLVEYCYNQIRPLWSRKEEAVITQAFNKLEPEKQRRILDAALTEFTKYGYVNASTNRIVKEAAIGKGMLFYYFKTKEELFRYCLEYSLDYIAEAYVAKLDLAEPDFIIRFTKAAQTKMQAYLANPLPFTLLASVVIRKETAELVPDLHQRFDKMMEHGLQDMFAGIDTGLFRPDVPPQHIINLIRWAVDGWSREILAELENEDLTEFRWEHVLANFDEFMATLRKVFYQEGNHGDSAGK